MGGAAAGWGELADRKGPWVCLLFASSLSVSGFVFLALGSVSTGDVADRITTMALFILGCAGPGVFNGGYLGGVQVTNDVPTLKAALTSFSAAAFDGSALVFMLFQAAATGLQLGLAIPSLVWAGVTAVCAATFTKFLHSELAGPKVVEPSHHLEGSNGVLGASPMKNDRLIHPRLFLLRRVSNRPVPDHVWRGDRHADLHLFQLRLPHRGLLHGIPCLEAPR